MTAADKPWLAKYPKGIRAEIPVDTYNSLVDLLESCFKEYSSLTAFECEGATLTYNELEEQTKRFATYLQTELGLKPGDRIAIQLPNIMQYPIVLLGALRAGLVVVNTNPLYTVREMEHQFKDSGAKAIVILENFASNLEQILTTTQIEHVIVTSVGDMFSFPKSLIADILLKYVKKVVPSYSIPKALKLKNILASTNSAGYKRPELHRETLAFLQYTGGTTGVSKGAMLSHGNVLANVLQNVEWMGDKLRKGKEFVITPLPLYHIFSLTVNCFTMFTRGAHNLLIPNPRDLDKFIGAMKGRPFSVITAVNTLFNGMLNHPRFAELDFSHLRVVVGGGMAVQNPVAERWLKVTKCPLVQGYGLTETSPVLSCNPLNGKEQLGTIGLVFPNTEVKLCDDDGNEVPIGEAGEICGKGPQVMKGYWQRKDETDKVFLPDGFFRTGDIGVLQEDGYIRIVDRKKDMILVSGFNVFPNEVEDVVAAHPKVLEVAAVGVADKKSTEAVKLFIVRKDESLTPDEIKQFCKKQLTAYKCPKHIEFRDELPKTNVGKILRRKLRDEERQKEGAAV